MRKESRNNLIFFVLLLAICLPGITMLVRKKLSQPPGHQMGFSSPVRLEVPYVDPIPVGSDIRLTYPPRLRGWVRSLAPTAPADFAQVSASRSFELIERETTDGQTRMTLLIWDPRVALDSARYRVGTTEARIDSVTTVDLPKEALSELRRAGYLAPPTSVPRVRLLLPATADGAVLRLEASRDGRPFADELRP